MVVLFLFLLLYHLRRTTLTAATVQLPLCLPEPETIHLNLIQRRLQHQQLTTLIDDAPLVHWHRLAPTTMAATTAVSARLPLRHRRCRHHHHQVTGESNVHTIYFPLF